MSDRMLFIDTETGGVNPAKHSLLSVGAVVWEKGIGELASYEFYLESNNYVVTRSASRINHFDQSEHNGKAVSAKEVIKEFYRIKKEYFNDYTSIPLAGHNTQFDVAFIKVFFEKAGRSYEKLFLHRVVDTYSIIKFLTDANLLPSSVNSSASAFKYFNISVNGRHTALGDAYATMQLYEKLIELLTNCK